MPSRLALNINPNGLDPVAQVLALGATAVRFPLKPWVDTRAVVLSYSRHGVTSILCSDNDTEPGHDHWKWAREYRQRLDGLDDWVVIQAGNNEFDSDGASSSPQAEQDLFNELVAWNEVFRGYTLVSPGMTSGHPERWSQRCNALVDAVCIHPYVPQAHQLKDAILRYRVWQKPLWVTEFPYYHRDYGVEVLRWSEGPATIYTLRSWQDGNGNSYLDGIYDLAGRPTWRVASIPTVNWTKPTEAKMAFVVSPQLLDKMKQKADKPASDEYTDPMSGNTKCAGEKYLWEYNKVANRTYVQEVWDSPK